MGSSTPHIVAALAAAVTLPFVITAPAHAQDRPPASEPETTRVDDVVVVGTSLRRQVETFVGAVTEPPRHHGPARWRGRVCVGVVNLRRDVAQEIADRVSDIAGDLGLSVGEPGCGPNVLIIATDDASGLAAALVADKPTAFRPRYSGSSRSRTALTRFVTEDRPVRWWHVSMPVVGETGTPAVRMPGGDPPSIPGEGRLRTSVRNVLLRTYVIIDLDQVEHLSLRQLSDYVAMAALAQIAPDAQVTDYPTILNVIDDPSTASEITDWDRAYLGGVYGAEFNQRNVRAQEGRISDLMFRDRRRAETQAARED